MTNSHASSTKCLSNALPSGNYAMSQSHRYSDDSKEFIFVKLTDSAFRAIEEYQRNEHAKRLAPGQRAKIQFRGNSGIIHFPLPGGNDNGCGTNGINGGSGANMDSGRKFGFTIDNLEGSPECIQQQQTELDVLGALALRMRIHANDDVYDTTRTKMAKAEETEKSKCIREIKPNQSDIGRKVKKPSSSSSSSNSNIMAAFHNGNNNSSSSNSFNSNNSNSNNSRKLVSSPFNGLAMSTTAAAMSSSSSLHSAMASSARSPNPSALGASGTVSNGSSNHQQRYQSGSSSSSAAASLASTFANGVSQGCAGLSGSSPRDIALTHGNGNGVISASNGRSKVLSGARSSSVNAKSSSSSSNGKQSNSSAGGGSNANGSTGKMSDVSRRKIRERLIHLLALKPYKKPELYARLQNEGIRDSERHLISNILMDISIMSHNVYNLRRQMWNDVDENWPYFSEQELQQLKRRKPQNLTPPMSSDAGSNTSGQSPTSTHTGSPPPMAMPLAQNVPNVSAGSLKRSSLEYDDSTFSTVAPKKMRISHYNKEACGSGSGSGSAQPTSRSSYGSRATPPQRQQQPLALLDEHSSDLSYNVLDNMDEFMSMTAEQQGSSYYGSSRHSSGAKQSATKDKRNSSGSNSSSSSSGYETQLERNGRQMVTTTTTTSTTGATSRKSSASTSMSTPPKSNNGAAAAAAAAGYGSSFVPAGKRSSSSSSNGSGSKLQAAPATQPPAQRNAAHDEYNSYNNNTHAASNSKKRTSSSSTNGYNNPSSSSSSSSSSSHSQRHHQQQKHQQQQQHRAYKQVPPPPSPPSHRKEPSTSPAAKHPSPTQQLAAAAHAYATSDQDASAEPRYDFSQYAPIMTLEVRRRYKTEFESDYDEYRKLLMRVEDVRKRFQDLSERLESARRRDTAGDYDNIRRQIVSEYERINSDRTIREDKQRFDYLHAKLAHIKQLVMDYDKTLTSGGVVAAAPPPQPPPPTHRQQQSMARQQEQQQHHQQEQHCHYVQQQQHHALETLQQQHYSSNGNSNNNNNNNNVSHASDTEDSTDSSDSNDDNDDDDEDDCDDDSNSNTDDDERY